jgi:signal peptidase I
MSETPSQQSREPIVTAGNERRVKSVWREYAEAIGMALLLALFIRTFVVQAFKIPSGSMIPTLQIGDHILVNKLAYGIRIPLWGEYALRFKKVEPGDVVVFVFPEDRSKDFIKRVIAIPGDVVEIRDKKVYVNDRPLDDPHAYFEGEEPGSFKIRDNYGPMVVPTDRLFVMGDNRDRSYDSRFWGFVDLRDVKGRAFLIYWSWDGADRWIRWERLGSLIY